MSTPAAAAPQHPRSLSLRWDGTISAGTLIHLAVLLLAAVSIWHAIDVEQRISREHMRILGEAVQDVQVRSARIEAYLSSRDGAYWESVSRIPPPPPSGVQRKEGGR